MKNAKPPERASLDEIIDELTAELILQSGRNASGEIKQTFAAKFDMNTMLHIVRGPVAFGSSIVSFIE
jgi:hypothetical protein